MKAYTRNRYGGPEILKIEEVTKPSNPADEEVIIRVMANSMNPADWHLLRGKPFFARFTVGLFKPNSKIPGADFAGIVDSVGKKITHLKPGDRVFGETLLGGAFAEYTCAPARVCAKMPDGLGFKDMAAVPVAGITAYQGLVTHGKLQAGETVLINGASGGVGHFTVQIAKALGAKVTAVCSSRNVDFVRSLGADHTIAYDQENIHAHTGKYDLVVDTNGNLTHSDFRRMGNRGITIGFTNMGHMFRLLLKKAVNKFPLAQFTAEANSKDLEALANMVAEGKIKAHIEKVYPYTELPDALGYIEAMRTRGKVVVEWD